MLFRRWFWLPNIVISYLLPLHFLFVHQLPLPHVHGQRRLHPLMHLPSSTGFDLYNFNLPLRPLCPSGQQYALGFNIGAEVLSRVCLQGIVLLVRYRFDIAAFYLDVL